MRSFAFLSLFLFLLLGMAPTVPDEQHLTRLELEVADYFRELRMAGTDTEKSDVAQHIDTLFRAILHHPESYDHPFDSLLNIGKIYSPDRLVRIYTWNVPMNDGTQIYYGYIQRLHKGRVLCYQLEHVPFMVPDTLSCYSDTSWYGALYYDIFEKSCNEKTYYIVLGMDLNNFITTRKIIDVILFEKDHPTFGASIFEKGESVLNRVIFEYSSQVSMMLRYDPAADMIIFDHLSPHETRFEGQYQYYGPDFSYDGFRFESCRWAYTEDLDLRNTLR